MKYNPEVHHRRSVRYPGYDYRQSGAYFVTLCAYQKAAIFGRIVDDAVELSPLGEIADQVWRDIPAHKPMVQCPVWVVMPNHMHGIILIVNDNAEEEALTYLHSRRNKPDRGVFHPEMLLGPDQVFGFDDTPGMGLSAHNQGV
ncbi:MAG: hypothetical protein P1S60_13075 [Anaerolineae bacterium]|nr:hypothetical protein [Anaerolineae bacterium]